MNKFGACYTFYAFFFNISRILFPLRKNRVAFVSFDDKKMSECVKLTILPLRPLAATSNTTPSFVPSL